MSDRKWRTEGLEILFLVTVRYGTKSKAIFKYQSMHTNKKINTNFVHPVSFIFIFNRLFIIVKKKY